MQETAVDVSELNVVLAGQKALEIKVPSGYVSESWMPLHEDHILFTGDRLFNGAVVVNAERQFRENPEILEPAYRERNPGWTGPSPYDRARVRETSRWCIVTNLRTYGDIVKFDALYADGTIVPRSYNKSISWAVQRRTEVRPEENFESSLKALTSRLLKNLNIPEDLFDVQLPPIPESLKGIKYDPKFLDLFMGGTWDSIPENSAAGEADEKPPVSPTNFERRLRDADSRSKVRQILKERDDFFGPRLEKKMLEGSNPEHLQTVPAGQLIIGDVFFIAGSTYKVTSLAVYVEFPNEVQVEVNKIGTEWTKSVAFNLDEKVNVAQRS